jgi:hypothetical protein
MISLMTFDGFFRKRLIQQVTTGPGPGGHVIAQWLQRFLVLAF